MNAMRTSLTAIFLILFFLFPYTVPALGFSPSLLPGLLIFLFSIKPLLFQVRRKELYIILAFLCLFLISLLASLQPDKGLLRVWMTALIYFGLMRASFSLLNEKALHYGADVLMLLWSVTSILQVTVGKTANVSAWFGAPSGTVYATGLTLFSSQAAAMMMVLCIWTLVARLDKISSFRSVIWVLGIAALYFTLSRAGWLGLLIAMGVLGWRLRHDPRRATLAIYAVMGMATVLACWFIPTQVRIYQPGGEHSGDRWSPISWEIQDQAALSKAGQDYSFNTRLVTLRVAVRATIEHPFIGIGLGHFPEYYAAHFSEYANGHAIDPRMQMTPHNGFLQFLAELGIPAFIVLMIWIVSVVKGTASRSDPAGLALHAAIIGYMVWMLCHDGLYDRLFWILLGSASALRSRIPQ